MITGDKGRAFQHFVSYRQGPFRQRTSLDNAAEQIGCCQEVLTELQNSGLLTTVATNARVPRATDIELPYTCIVDPLDEEPITISGRDVRLFMLACAVAKWRLAFRPIESTVRLVADRKHQRASNIPFSISQARKLVRIFTRLRPLVPQDFRCIYDSLALLDFLSRYDCFPDWIFAVRLDPWSAHCWVQHGSVSLNQDTHEAHTYLPLMAV